MMWMDDLLFHNNGNNEPQEPLPPEWEPRRIRSIIGSLRTCILRDFHPSTAIPTFRRELQQCWDRFHQAFPHSAVIQSEVDFLTYSDNIIAIRSLYNVAVTIGNTEIIRYCLEMGVDPCQSPTGSILLDAISPWLCLSNTCQRRYCIYLGIESRGGGGGGGGGGVNPPDLLNTSTDDTSSWLTIGQSLSSFFNNSDDETRTREGFMRTTEYEPPPFLSRYKGESNQLLYHVLANIRLLIDQYGVDIDTFLPTVNDDVDSLSRHSIQGKIVIAFKELWTILVTDAHPILQHLFHYSPLIAMDTGDNQSEERERDLEELFLSSNDRNSTYRGSSHDYPSGSLSWYNFPGYDFFVSYFASNRSFTGIKGLSSFQQYQQRQPQTSHLLYSAGQSTARPWGSFGNFFNSTIASTSTLPQVVQVPSTSYGESHLYDMDVDHNDDVDVDSLYAMLAQEGNDMDELIALQHAVVPNNNNHNLDNNPNSLSAVAGSLTMPLPYPDPDNHMSFRALKRHSMEQMQMEQRFRRRLTHSSPFSVAPSAIVRRGTAINRLEQYQSRLKMSCDQYIQQDAAMIRVFGRDDYHSVLKNMCEVVMNRYHQQGRSRNGQIEQSQTLPMISDAFQVLLKVVNERIKAVHILQAKLRNYQSDETTAESVSDIVEMFTKDETDIERKLITEKRRMHLMMRTFLTMSAVDNVLSLIPCDSFHHRNGVMTATNGSKFLVQMNAKELLSNDSIQLQLLTNDDLWEIMSTCCKDSNFQEAMLQLSQSFFSISGSKNSNMLLLSEHNPFIMIQFGILIVPTELLFHIHDNGHALIVKWIERFVIHATTAYGMTRDQALMGLLNDVRDSNGSSLLIHAAKQGKKRTMDALLVPYRGFLDINAIDHNGESALVHCCRQGASFRPLIMLLVNDGACFDGQIATFASQYIFLPETFPRYCCSLSHHSSSALASSEPTHASVSSSAAVVEPVLNILCRGGAGNLATIRFLVQRVKEQGRETNNKDCVIDFVNRCHRITLQTPLMIASMKGCKDIVKFLKEEGAMVDAQDCDGKIALDYAMTEEIQALLM